MNIFFPSISVANLNVRFRWANASEWVHVTQVGNLWLRGMVQWGLGRGFSCVSLVVYIIFVKVSYLPKPMINFRERVVHSSGENSITNKTLCCNGKYRVLSPLQFVNCHVMFWVLTCLLAQVKRLLNMEILFEQELVTFTAEIYNIL